MSDPDAEWEVEDILDIRWDPINNRVEFHIKWTSFPEENNTWEPEDNISAPLLLEKWKDRVNELAKKNGARMCAKVVAEAGSGEGTTRARDKKHRIISPLTKDEPQQLEETEVITGDPEKVIGVSTFSNKILYLVKFKGERQEESRLVSSSVLREKYHQLIIDFYEPKIRFASLPKHKELTNIKRKKEEDDLQEAAEYIYRNRSSFSKSEKSRSSDSSTSFDDQADTE